MKTFIIAAAASAFTFGAFAASHAEKGAPMAKPAASAPAASAPAAKAAAKPAAKASAPAKAASK